MLIEVITPFFIALVVSGAFWYYIKSPIQWIKNERKMHGEGFGGGKNQTRLVAYNAGKENSIRKK